MNSLMSSDLGGIQKIRYPLVLFKVNSAFQGGGQMLSSPRALATHFILFSRNG